MGLKSDQVFRSVECWILGTKPELGFGTGSGAGSGFGIGIRLWGRVTRRRLRSRSGFGTRSGYEMEVGVGFQGRIMVGFWDDGWGRVSGRGQD